MLIYVKSKRFKSTLSLDNVNNKKKKTNHQLEGNENGP